MPAAATGLKRIKSGKGHWYKLDGVKVDGVTTLIGKGVPKPALPYWAARTVAEYVAGRRDHMRECMEWMDDAQLVAHLKEVPWTVRDQAAVNGTEVHDLADKLSRGFEVDVPEHLAGYVDSCVRFLDDWKPVPILTETTVASRKWKYAGTLDGVYELPSGEVVIADWKTGKSGIYAETCLQLAAYAHAEFYVDDDGHERTMADLGITGGLAVWLRPDGYDVYRLPVDDKQFSAFLHAATVARWAQSCKDLVGEPCEPAQAGAA